MHSERVEYVVDLYDLASRISRKINKVVGAQPQDYMVSSDLERAADLMDMCRTRGVEFQGLAPWPKNTVKLNELKPYI